MRKEAHTHAQTHTHTHTHTRTHACTHTHTYTHTHKHIHTQYLLTHTRTHTYTCKHSHARACTHTHKQHAHTQMHTTLKMHTHNICIMQWRVDSHVRTLANLPKYTSARTQVQLHFAHQILNCTHMHVCTSIHVLVPSMHARAHTHAHTPRNCAHRKRDRPVHAATN